jgi:D-glycerate 3-kinase
MKVVIDLKEAIARAQPALQQRVHQLRVRLDETFVEGCVGELAQHLLARAGEIGGCPIIGLSGAQGAGKSTLAWLLSDLLTHGFGKRVVVVSLDDYYLSQSERLTLAERVHPLLRTRGVPGTHAHPELLAALRQLRAGRACALLRFDKSIDDREPKPRNVSGPCDLILFEGWCVGARAQTEAELLQPINTLEEDEDRDGAFRRFVNMQLEGPYASLWRELDVLVYLAAPDFQTVQTFRAEQEASLKSRSTPGAKGLMDDAALSRFVQHFERITLHMLRGAPSYAEVIVQLDAARHFLLNIKPV